MVIGSNCCALDLIRFHVKCLFVNRVINKNVAVCWLCKKCSHCDKMPYYEANKKKEFSVIVQCTLFHRTWDSIWFLVLCNRTATRIFDNYVFWMSLPSINFWYANISHSFKIPFGDSFIENIMFFSLIFSTNISCDPETEIVVRKLHELSTLMQNDHDEAVMCFFVFHGQRRFVHSIRGNIDGKFLMCVR